MIIRTNYTDKDNAFIRDNYQDMSDNQMAGILHRTRRGIEAQRFKLGLYHERTLRHVHQALLAQKEMRGLEQMLQDGRMRYIAERRLDELRIDHKFARKSGNTQKIPKDKQALCYELYQSGISVLAISKRTGYTWAMVDLVIKRISPYSGPNPVTITIPSKL